MGNNDLSDFRQNASVRLICPPTVEYYRHAVSPIMMEIRMKKGFVNASMDTSRPSTCVLSFMLLYVMLCFSTLDTVRRRADLHKPCPPRIEHIPAVTAEVRRCTATVLIRCIVIYFPHRLSHHRGTKCIADRVPRTSLPQRRRLHRHGAVSKYRCIDAFAVKRDMRWEPS